jgi:hypothetical protein
MSKDILKFIKKNVGNMTRSEFVDYYNNEWFPFMEEVSNYAKSLNTLLEMLGLKKPKPSEAMK